MHTIDRLANELTGLFYFDKVKVTIESMGQLSVALDETEMMRSTQLIEMVDISKKYNADIRIFGAPTWSDKEHGVEFSFCLSDDVVKKDLANESV